MNKKNIATMVIMIIMFVLSFGVVSCTITKTSRGVNSIAKRQQTQNNMQHFEDIFRGMDIKDVRQIMKKYGEEIQISDDNRGCVVLGWKYMGSFYEVYFKDGKVTNKTMNLDR